MVDRTCIVTRNSRPADEMIRFVAAPDGAVVPDLKNRLPGRGAWVTADAATLRKAVSKGFFARALKCRVSAAADLDEQVADLLKQQALGALGMAMKAGAVVAGFGKAEAAISGRKAGVVLHAADGAPDGLRKLKRAAKRSGSDAEAGLRWITGFHSDELGLAIGRESVVHAVLKPGRMADAFAAKAMKWCRFTGAAEIKDDMTVLADSPGQE